MDSAVRGYLVKQLIESGEHAPTSKFRHQAARNKKNLQGKPTMQKEYKPRKTGTGTVTSFSKTC